MSDYATPACTGLSSDATSCQKVIKQVLDVLTYPEMRFEQNDVSFEDDCKMFRLKLFQRLKASGWKLHYDEHGLKVKAPK